MARLKELKTLSMPEAMNNLAVIAGIDLASLPRLGVIHHRKFITDTEMAGAQQVFWLGAEGVEAIQEILDMTFRTIHQYLVSLLESSEVNWDDPKVTRSIQSMVSLVLQAARKMDDYLALRLGQVLTTKTEERISYQDLLFFYQNRFSRQIKKIDEVWTDDAVKDEGSVLFEITNSGLIDLETVRRDQQYELFSIRNENGDFFFSADLLRDINVVCFEAGAEVSFEDDPLLHVRAMQERNLLACSQQILSACRDLIEKFYQSYPQIQSMSLAKSISKMVMALSLSVNPRNLIQNTSNKSVYLYFHDFQIFLRETMNTAEYQKLIAYPPNKKDEISNALLFLVHSLCQALFMRSTGIREETVAMLHRCMRRGEEKNKANAIKGNTIWNQFLVDDEKFRTLLGQFPSGPLFRILDQVREEDPELMTFDPLMQGNLPQKVYEIQFENKIVHVLSMPCPVRQKFINKAPIAEEFIGFLRFYATSSRPLKHLLINLQDRGSWQEYARSLGLESLQKNAEFNNELIVATIPKNTDFYYQYGDYVNVSSANDFMASFLGMFSHPEEFGFFIPPQLVFDRQDLFFDRAIHWVHHAFFGGRDELNRRDREDFIEIFYLLLVLKWIEVGQIDSISLTCKDGIDAGAASLAVLYGFIYRMKADFLVGEIGFLQMLLYAPALFVRERVIDLERLTRAIAVLEKIDMAIEENRLILNGLEELYRSGFIKSLLVQRL
jgi:hypothetical protein